MWHRGLFLAPSGRRLKRALGLQAHHRAAAATAATTTVAPAAATKQQQQQWRSSSSSSNGSGSASADDGRLPLGFPTVCVWGANTGVGKTLVSAGLARAAALGQVSERCCLFVLPSSGDANPPRPAPHTRPEA